MLNCAYCEHKNGANEYMSGASWCMVIMNCKCPTGTPSPSEVKKKQRKYGKCQSNTVQKNLMSMNILILNKFNKFPNPSVNFKSPVDMPARTPLSLLFLCFLYIWRFLGYILEIIHSWPLPLGKFVSCIFFSL